MNASGRSARLTFNLVTVGGETLRETPALGRGGQLSVSLGGLFPGRDTLQGALSIGSNRDIHVSGLLEVADGQGNTLLSPAPLVRGSGEVEGMLAERRVLPVVTVGAGQVVETVLLNPTDGTLRGQIELPGHSPVPYSVDAGGVVVHRVPSDGQALLDGYGMVRASGGVAPAAYAVVRSQRRDGSLRSIHTVSSHQEGTLFWGR